MKVSIFVHVLVALFMVQLCNQINLSLAIRTLPSQTYVDYIKTSCNVTIYPRLCCKSLSVYAEKIKTDPKLLAYTALNVTLRATNRASVLINRLSKTQGLRAIEAAAVQDCVEVIGDAVDELQDAIWEMGQLGSSDFALQISDIQTWVSAALTDDDTCVDGFAGREMDGRVKDAVRRHVLKVAHLTSNALALVNSYASAQAALP
ncbi:Pectinesterase inhibitor domain containing protein [Parasponia andersonii]|uniref:Pectinesterase inhibitor domain containing protein n=1 Tax=Parasponia andersonii TaxID=3476 RepID=A0A2P5BYH5_PARAD|nr:Pectinesterase inhibitor domain containing protein [Parasponia andersonii]